MPKITEIRIPSKWHDPETKEDIRRLAVFRLGVGPCGKEVVALAFDPSAGNVGHVVTQTHADATRKYFIYRHEDLIGRVEVLETL